MSGMTPLSTEWVPAPGGYAIFRGAEQVSGFYGQYALADERRLRMVADEARKARSRTRKCLRCGVLFLSEGPHHRMCDGCRAVSGFEHDGAAWVR